MSAETLSSPRGVFVQFFPHKTRNTKCWLTVVSIEPTSRDRRPPYGTIGIAPGEKSGIKSEECGPYDGLGADPLRLKGISRSPHGGDRSSIRSGVGHAKAVSPLATSVRTVWSPVMEEGPATGTAQQQWLPTVGYTQIVCNNPARFHVIIKIRVHQATSKVGGRMTGPIGSHLKLVRQKNPAPGHRVRGAPTVKTQ